MSSPHTDEPRRIRPGDDLGAVFGTPSDGSPAHVEAPASPMAQASMPAPAPSPSMPSPSPSQMPMSMAQPAAAPFAAPNAFAASNAFAVPGASTSPNALAAPRAFAGLDGSAGPHASAAPSVPGSHTAAHGGLAHHGAAHNDPAQNAAVAFAAPLAPAVEGAASVDARTVTAEAAAAAPRVAWWTSWSVTLGAAAILAALLPIAPINVVAAVVPALAAIVFAIVSFSRDAVTSPRTRLWAALGVVLAVVGLVGSVLISIVYLGLADAGQPGDAVHVATSIGVVA